MVSQLTAPLSTGVEAPDFVWLAQQFLRAGQAIAFRALESSNISKLFRISLFAAMLFFFLFAELCHRVEVVITFSSDQSTELSLSELGKRLTSIQLCASAP
jgi:hypothetical protein